MVQIAGDVPENVQKIMRENKKGGANCLLIGLNFR